MEDFPRILGHPGKPGYRGVAMGRLSMTAQMFNSLDSDEREDLARDWDSGHKVLLSHRQFLRRQFRTLRRRGLFHLVMKAVRGAINDHPVWVALGTIGAVALVYFLIFVM